MEIHAWAYLVILTASAAAPTALARPKGVSLASALVGVTEPVCRVKANGSAVQVDMVCPDGSYKDDNNPYCYEPCSAFDNTPPGVTYANSTQNDDHCVPRCAATYTRMSSTTSAVTCFNCPAGYVGVVGKGCWSACNATYPVQWTKSVRPLCAQRCPPATPNATSDPNQCTGVVNGKDTYARRLTRPRTQVPPTKTVRLPVKPRSEVDMVCPRGASFYSLHWDDDAPDEFHSTCWTCPAGQQTGLWEDSWVYCAPSACPDASYSRCGDFCYASALPLPAAEADCEAFLGVFDCIPSCYPDPEDTHRRRK